MTTVTRTRLVCPCVFAHSLSNPPHPAQAKVRKARRSLRYKSTTYPRTVGLENGHAAADIRDLRGLIDAWREARRAAWQTAVKVVTAGVPAALLVGVADIFTANPVTDLFTGLIKPE